MTALPGDMTHLSRAEGCAWPRAPITPKMAALLVRTSALTVRRLHPRISLVLVLLALAAHRSSVSRPTLS